MDTASLHSKDIASPAVMAAVSCPRWQHLPGLHHQSRDLNPPALTAPQLMLHLQLAVAEQPQQALHVPSLQVISTVGFWWQHVPATHQLVLMSAGLQL